MKKFLSLCSLVLIISLVLTSFAACGEKKQEDAGSIAENGATEAQQDTEIAGETVLYPNLPDVSYDGYTFTFLAHLYDGDDWVGTEARELVAEEETGEPINDAVYIRNSVIKEKYNIDIKMISLADEKAALKKNITSGDDLYDAVLMFNNNVPGIVTGDLLMDVSELPYLDLSKPWWDPALKSLSIGNKNYLLGGDILILDNEAANALVFNKDLMAVYGLELPYNLVKEGKWTFDKLYEFITLVSEDLNGDGNMTYDADRFGLLTFNDTLQALLVSGGGTFALKDGSDIPYMSFASERNLQVISKAMDIMFNKKNVLNYQTVSSAKIGYPQIFSESRALFMWMRMRVVENLRSMDSDFGIIPLPKYDEQQDGYHSLVNAYTGVLLGIPKSVRDVERTSVILEALAAESRYTLQPAYYDVTLQRKFTRDDESADMLNIIFNTRVYDVGGVYSFGDVFNGFTTLASKEDRNVVSYYEKNGPKMEKAIDKVVAIFDAMD